MFWIPDEVGEHWPDGVTHVSRPTRNGASPALDKDMNGEYELPERGMGLPATARDTLGNVIDMDENLQEFLHQSCCDRAGLPYDNDYAKKSFASFTRGNAYAFDFAGSNTRHDYINDTNEDAENIQNKPMLTADAVMEIVGDTKNDWVIRAINVLKDDVWKYKYTDPDHAGLWYSPQNSRRERIIVNGKWTGKYDETLVNTFHMYNGKVIMWNFSLTNYLQIPKSRVILL